MGSHNRQRALVLAALFCSGVAGLMHEVVWAKLLANLTGSTAKSHAVVLSVFMGGLAVGAVLFGRRSDKRERPLMVYVLLELAIGVYCLLLPFITRGAGFVYEQMAGAVFEQQGLKVPLRLLLSLSVVALPAILMGGTLPVLARYLIEEVAQTRKAVASLYALNNIGAVLGSGAAGFYLLPEFGIYGSLITASSLNFLAAGIVWIANARTPYVASGASTAEAVTHDALPHYNARQFKATLWALALSGFAAMGYEVVFLRVIALGFGSSTYSFTVMLMCFITGIGLGSLIISLVDVKRPMWWLALSQLGVIVSLLAVTPIIERLPYLVSSWRTQTLLLSPDPTINEPIVSSFEKFVSGQFGLCFLILIVPTMLIGMGFPLVSQIQARSIKNIGGTIGSTYAWNTIGNVLGVVITSLLLMPLLGMEHSLHFNLALNVIAALLLTAAASETSLVPRSAAWLAGLAAIFLYVGHWARDPKLEANAEQADARWTHNWLADVWSKKFQWVGWATTITHSEGHLRLREGPFDGKVRSPNNGVITTVHVKEGERIEHNAPLCIITDESGGQVEIDAPATGVVQTIQAHGSDSVAVGAELMTLLADDDAVVHKHHQATNFPSWKRKYVHKAEDWDEMLLDEDPDTNVMTVRRGRMAALYVNSKGDASTGPLDMITFLLTGHIPMFLLPDAEDVMVIGHGSGVTTGGMLLHPIKRLDLVEISKGVLKADRLFAWANHDCLNDPRTHVYIDDARTFLRTVPRKYDLIVSQPSNPWIAGIGSLFTVDFFQDCKARLKPGGAMIVWFHHYEQSDETIQLIIRTIATAFPHIESFLTYNSDVIAFASMTPVVPDFARMEERFDVPAVRSDLGRVGVFNLATVLAYHAVSADRFRDFLGEGPLNTDDHQRLEYKGARNMYAGRDAFVLADPRTDVQRVVDKAHTASAEELNAPYFDAAPDGSTSWMLDRYSAWRAQQGDPLTRAELEVARNTTNNILTSSHRLAKLVARRFEQMAPETPAQTKPGAQPARGGDVPIDQLQYSEAFNRGVYLAYLSEQAKLRVQQGLDTTGADQALADRLMEQAITLFQRAVDASKANIGKEPTSADAVTRLAQLITERPNPKAPELQAKIREIQALAAAGKNDEAFAVQQAAKPLLDEYNALERPKMDQAVALLQSFIALRSDKVKIDTNVDLMLAGLFLRTERMDQATAIYMRLIDEERNPAAYTRLGEMTGNIGKDYDLAENYFQKALERDPKMWEASANLARILMDRAIDAQQDQLKHDQLARRAMDVLDYALFLSPNNQDLRALRARIQPTQAMAPGPQLPSLGAAPQTGSTGGG